MQLILRKKFSLSMFFYFSIKPNLKSTVYCVALREGGVAEWKFAYKQYLETTSASEKEVLLNALGCTRDPSLLSKYVRNDPLIAQWIIIGDEWCWHVSIALSISDISIWRSTLNMEFVNKTEHVPSRLSRAIVLDLRLLLTSCNPILSKYRNSEYY